MATHKNNFGFFSYSEKISSNISLRNSIKKPKLDSVANIKNAKTARINIPHLNGFNSAHINAKSKYKIKNGNAQNTAINKNFENFMLLVYF